MKGTEGRTVVCIGELLVDFMAEGTALDAGKAQRFIKSPGGAVANVAVGLARLGERARFVGKVGSDPFGLYLKDVLRREGVDVSRLLVSEEYPTGLVFVVLDEKKVPRYCFFGNPSADMMLEYDEIGAEVLDQAVFVHAGTVSMVREPARCATFELIRQARRAGIKVSFDPNLRLHLWKDHDYLRRMTKDALGLAHLAKLSGDELLFLTGESDYKKGARLIAEPGPEVVVVTLGDEGAYFFSSQGEGQVSPFKVKVKDTTGAGDGFAAGLIHVLCCEEWPPSLEVLERAVRFASAVGALATTGMGAVESLPDKRDVEDLMEWQSGI